MSIKKIAQVKTNSTRIWQPYRYWYILKTCILDLCILETQSTTTRALQPHKGKGGKCKRGENNFKNNLYSLPFSHKETVSVISRSKKR